MCIRDRLGIDLGTSGIKAVVINETGEVVSMGYAEQNVITPKSGFAEQNPEVWWEALSLIHILQFNSNKVKKKVELQKIIVYIAIIVAFLVFSITLGDAGFLSVNNQINILRQMTTIGIMSFGMTFVIGCGEIDLTVGANIATSGLVAAIVMRAGGHWIIAVIAALATGILIGLINGVILVVTGLPSFLITIGTLTILNGVSTVSYTHLDVYKRQGYT